MFKVLIMGGTGAMGVPLVQLCVDAGYNTIVTTRKVRQSNYSNLKYIQIDAHSEEFDIYLRDKHFDCIIDFMVYSYELFKSRINLLLKHTGQYCFISSCRVFAGDRLINEESPRLLDVSRDEVFLSKQEYSLEKAREENIIIGQSSKNWTIVRPYITYNEERLQLGYFEKEDWLLRGVNHQKIVFPIDLLDKKTTMTYGNDVALFLFKIVGFEDALGQKYNITCGKSYTWKEIIDFYKKAFYNVFGYELHFKFYGNSYTYSKVFSSIKYKINYCRMYDRVFDNAKCMKILGEDFLFSDTEDSLEQCMNSFKNKGCPARDLSPYYYAYFDRKTHELSNIKLFKGIKRKLRYCLLRFAPFPYDVCGRIIEKLYSYKKQNEK